MADDSIKLIIGLGNPGQSYADTRHNAGAWFVEHLAQAYKETLNLNKKFFGYTCRILVNNQQIHLLIPFTYMNCSGQSVAAFAKFYRISVESMFVVHDELDFPPGVARIKKGGGHGGHNGLRDIISKMGNNRNFTRLRIGIGHPGHSKDVSNYVLKPPSKSEKLDIEMAVSQSIRIFPDFIDGSRQKAIKQLHENCKK